MFKKEWQKKYLDGKYSLAAQGLLMLGLCIVLYGLEGIYLHVSVWKAQKTSQSSESCTFRRGGGVNCLGSKNPK